MLVRDVAEPDAVVLGLPRGGVPVAYEIATRLDLPLDVFVVRKLGMPDQPELAMGAIASGGVRVLHGDLIARTGVKTQQLDDITAIETEELHRRERVYRGDRPPLSLEGHEVILADDGLATGASMRAAVLAVRAARPRRIVAAVPVGAPQAVEALRAVADDVICASAPPHFTAVGTWYADFSATTDDEVRALLADAWG